MKEAAEIEEKTKQMGITKEEYDMLSVLMNHNPKATEAELIPFVRGLAKQVKTRTFPGWQKNRRAVKDVEQEVFDSCF